MYRIDPYKLIEMFRIAVYIIFLSILIWILNIAFSFGK